MNPVALLPFAGEASQLLQPIAHAAREGEDFLSQLAAALSPSQAEPDKSADRPLAGDTDSLLTVKELLTQFPRTDIPAIQLDQLQVDLETELSAWHRKVAEALSKQGIDLTKGVTLAIDSAGKPVIQAAAPQQAIVDEFFQANPELANQMRKLLSNFSLLQAAQQHNQFAREYEQDPLAAISRYAHLLKDSPEYSLKVDLFEAHIEAA